MSNIYTVTIGIPAYNEEANIALLLQTLLKLNYRKTRLQRIVVVSDGSTDETVKRIKSVRSRLIRTITLQKRRGQAYAQNKIINLCRSDILVLLNADISITDTTFVDTLVRPIIQDNQIGLVSAPVTPLKPLGLLDKVLNFSVIFKYALYSSVRNGKNVFSCHGRVRAFSKKLYKNFRFPTIVTEDAYSYFFCLTEGFKFEFQPDTTVYFRSPTSLRDHLKQSKRFFLSRHDLSAYFSKELIREEYAIPPYLLAKTIINYFLKNPFYMTFYCFIVLLSLLYPTQHNNTLFTPSVSSKKLFV